MAVPFTITVFDGVTADPYGDIDISTTGGYHGEDVERTFTAGELRVIIEHAEAHETAYEAFVASNYADEDSYFKAMKGFTL